LVELGRAEVARMTLNATASRAAKDRGQQIERGSRLIDMTGCRSGLLLVVRLAEREGRRLAYWVCQCDCGREHTVRGGHLRDGLVTHCGCRSAEIRAKGAMTHGMSKTPEYLAWCCMKNRCFKPQDKQYPNYGGRGIRVCDEWRNSFEAFFDHVGPRPSSDHSIDRINNDGNYEPGNVRWATPEEQARNTRCTKLSLEDAREIRRLRAAGVPFKVLRDRFGISDALISNIQADRVWKDHSSAHPQPAAACPPKLQDASPSDGKRHPSGIADVSAGRHRGDSAGLLAAVAEFHRGRAGA
jgi:hypothetical protein